MKITTGIEIYIARGKFLLKINFNFKRIIFIIGYYFLGFSSSSVKKFKLFLIIKKVNFKNYYF